VNWLTHLGGWITENESLLSGVAALIVVAGVVISPFGHGLRRFFGAGTAGAAEPELPGSSAASEPERAADPDSEPSGATSTGPSIAVLPFENMSDDSDQEYLADGMTEDLITGLAATPHLNVIARNSTFAYKGKSPDVRDVGRDLGVRYVLEGSVRRVGDKIRVTAQFIDASSGNHLWAAKYDRPYADIFDVQDEVVGEIAGTLSLQINKAEIARSRTVPPSNLQAWELVTQVMHHHLRTVGGLDSERRTLDLLKQAVALDETYAYARAAYAWMLTSAAINGLVDDFQATFDEGRAQLHAALELDLSDSLSQYYIGAAETYIGRWDKSVRFLKMSLAQNPHQPDALVHLGLAYGYQGNFEGAYACFDDAARMGKAESEAGFYAWYRGIVLGLEDRFAEAIAIIEPVIDHFPTYQTPKFVMAVFLDCLGEDDRARRLAARAMTLEPRLNIEGVMVVVGAHFDPEKGRQRVETLRKLLAD
jgi:adenylate cyclase